MILLQSRLEPVSIDIPPRIENCVRVDYQQEQQEARYRGSQAARQFR